MALNDKRIILLGDQVKGGRYLPFARSCVERLFSLSELQGGVSLEQNFKPENDVEVNVRVTNGQRYIRIKASGGCPPVLNGIGKVGLIVDVEDPSNPQKPFKYYQSFYPSQKQAEKEGVKREWMSRTELAVEPKKMYGFDNPQVQLAQSRYIKPSFFSGLMRKYVQLVMGRPGVEIGFDYTWRRTHGLFKNQITGKFWIIEVSRQGVYALEAQTCGGEDFDEFTPLTASWPEDQESFDNLIKLGKIKVLLNSNDSLLNDFYLKFPFFRDCGWAFNYLGNEAMNTAYDRPNDDFLRSYLYVLTINEDNKGDPTAAIIQKTKDSPLYSSADVSGLWMPDGTGLLDKFPLGRMPNKSSFIGVQDAPIYAYYNVDNKPRIIRRYYENVDRMDGADTSPGFDTDWTSGGLGPSAPRNIGNFGKTYISYDGCKVDSPKHGFADGDFTPVLNKFYNIYQERSTTNPVYSGVVFDTNGYHYGAHYANMYDTSHVCYFSKYRSKYAQLNYSAIVIPTGDRESYAIFTHFVESSESGSKSVNYWPIYTGVGWTTDITYLGGSYTLPVLLQAKNPITLESGGYRQAQGFAWFAGILGKHAAEINQVFYSPAELTEIGWLGPPPGLNEAISFATKNGCVVTRASGGSLDGSTTTQYDANKPEFTTSFKFHTSTGQEYEILEMINKSDGIFPVEPQNAFVFEYIVDAFSKDRYTLQYKNQKKSDLGDYPDDINFTPLNTISFFGRT